MLIRFLAIALAIPFALAGQTITCILSTRPLPVRAESLGDLIGDVLIECTQTRPGADTRQYLVGDVTLYLNTNVTNKPSPIYGGTLTDAVLVINDNHAPPTNASTLGGPQGNVPVPQYGEMYGSFVNGLIWRGVRIPMPGAPTGTGGRFPDPVTIRLSNVRSSANMLGVSASGIPALILVYSATVADAKSLSGATGVGRASVIYPGLSSALRKGPVNAIPVCEARPFAGTDPTFLVRVTEGFNTAFLPLGAPATASDQRTGEAGYPTPGIGVNGGGVTQGTRIRLMLANVPPGIQLAAPRTVASGMLRLQRVDTDVTGAGPYAPGTGEGLQQLSITGGTAVAVYEVIGADPKAAETIDVPFHVGLPAAGAAGLGQATVTAGLAPVSTRSTASASAPQPRFADTSSARYAFSVIPCTEGTPLVTGLSPSAALQGTPAFPLTITGMNFQPGSTVQWQGRNLPVTYVNPRTLTVPVTPAELQSASASGLADVVVINSDGTRSAVATFTVNAPPNAPRINSGGVVDAAAGRARLAPGGIASLYGVNLASGEETATTWPLPRTLRDARVLVNGVEAPLFYVSPGQINFQTPYEMPAYGTATVTVVRDRISSLAASVAAAMSAPQVFRGGNSLTPIVVHADGTLVTSAQPAAAGEILVVYATGVGALSRRPATGVAAPASPPATISDAVDVTVGGARVREVLFAGLTPGLAGLVQFNIRLPDTLPAGATLPLVVTVGDAASDPVDLAVR